MEVLYKEMLERLEELETRKKNKMNLGRISELQLAIVRVQQILLSNIPKKAEEPVELEEVEIPAPIGDFIIENATGTMGNDGVYYHYSDVCKLLKLYKDKK
jgi:hypothetical protein